MGKKIKRHLRLLLAGPILLGFILGACFSDSFTSHDPFKINPRNILKSPSKEHLFGTDQLGRDILSRIIYGSRISLSVAGVAVLIATIVGVPIGLMASYLGGRFENIVMRTIDIFVCLPEIFVAIVVIAFKNIAKQPLYLR